MINSNFGFTPLREVWLGDCYPVSYYDHLPSEARDAFHLITEWTKEDTEKLQKFLESQGIVVRRPVFDSIDDYLHNDVLVKPPICPRDDYMVLENTLYSLHPKTKKDPWQHWLDHYKNNGGNVQQPIDQAINCVYPPSIVRMGQDLYVDKDTHEHVWGYVCEWMVEQSKTYRINICQTNGHSDGVFCPVAPGILVSSHYKTDYKQTFPGWDVFHVPEDLNNFEVSGPWYVDNPVVSKSKIFADHVLKSASTWVGNWKETVFEVNMLVIDDKNVVAMKDYPPLTEWLYKRGINVHLFDFRTRNFWDGGWHCLTLDICRDDSKTDLFPDRGDNGIYWRLT